MEPKFIVVTFEAVYPLDREVGEQIAQSLEDLRGGGAAKAIATRFLTTDEEYTEWYRKHGITEVELPVPQVVTIDRW